MFNLLDAGFKFDGKNSTINLKTNAATLTLNSQIPNFSGKLKLFDDSSTRIVSNNANSVIIFSDGIVNSGSGDINFTGTFVPGALTTALQLGTGSSLNFTGQTILRPITIPAAQTAEIKGSPVLNDVITLSNSSSQLNLGLVNKMTQNILLGGGTVRLDEDLKFKDGKGFSGSGTVNINNRAFIRPGGFSYTGTINYQNARDIQFTDNQTLNGGTENYSGAGLYSLVNGNGYTWNIINSGRLQVGATHTLYLTDMRIKGLGPSGSAGYFDIDTTGSIILANVTLDLGGNYTHNKGTLLVQGDNCKLIHHNYSFSVSGANTRLQVDGSALLYEPLDGNKITPFSFTDLAQHIVYSNGGVIRTAESSGRDTALTISTTPYTLTANQRLTATSGLKFTNATPGTPKPMVLNGGGFYIQFPTIYAAALMELETNVQLTLNNITLKDFDPAMINYGAASSKIIFGENCRIQLARDVVINAGDKAWEFVLPSLPAYIDATGHLLTLNGSNRLTVNGSGLTAGRVNIENARVATKASNAFSCTHYNAEIAFKNSTLIMDNNGLNFTLGNIFIDGYSQFTGANPTTPSGTATFTFSSTGTLTVLTQASLEFKPDTTFIYQPTPTPGATPSSTTYLASKRKLKLTDPSAALILNGCTVQTTNTGLAIDYGKLFIHNKVAFTSSTSTGAEFEIGAALDVNIMGSGLFQIDGPVKYQFSSYP